MKPNRVAIIGADWPEYEKHCPNFTGMQQGLMEMGIDHQLFSCRPTFNVDGVIEYQPDFVIYGLLDMVKMYQERQKLRHALPNAKIVIWYGDLRNNDTGQIVANMSEIDAMFISNDAQSEYYKAIWKVPNCHFLPLGAVLYSPVYKKQFDLDFIFLGATVTNKKGFPHRAESVLTLKRHGLKIIDAPAQIKPELRAKILRDMPDLYRSAKVSLDWSHFTDIPGYTSNRFWIITASGGFALTKRWPGCTTFYPEGTRAYFDTIEEALELKEYYLSHPEEREKIRQAGYAHAIHHTYSKRFAKMFSVTYGQDTQDRLSLSDFQTPGTPV